MSEATSHSHDPSIEWSELLHGLTGVQRQAVVNALRHSANSGWPASREAVSSLVAYALGRISSREYAVQIMVALGYVGTQAAAMLAGRSQLPTPRPAQPTPYFDAGVGADFLSGH